MMNVLHLHASVRIPEESNMHNCGIFHRATFRVLLAFFLVLGVSTVQAHARLLKSEPAAQSIGAAPAQIALHFSEEIALALSSLTVTDPVGTPVKLTAVDRVDAKSLIAKPASLLAPGVYKVTWTAVASDDGHKTTGSYVFTVN